MYADDTTLSSTNYLDSFSDIAVDTTYINKLSLNKYKSKYMTFHMPKK